MEKHSLCRVMKMKKIQFKWVLFWVLLSEAVGFMAGFLSREGTQVYSQLVNKPPLSPPQWLFPVVWVVLYALMGIGAGLVMSRGRSAQRDQALNLMVAQLVVNFFWPLLFFNAAAYGLAFFWLLLLLVLVLWMTREFAKLSQLAAKLQIPYILWLLFAAYLNGAVWYLNG